MKPQDFLLPFLFILLAACAPLASQVAQEGRRDVPFSEVIKAPETFVGQSVVWGGIIIETMARPADTLMIARQADLDFQKRPRNPDKSAGRFIIRYEGFLDPAIYSRDREVTVWGKVAGKEERPVGDFLYAYPVIEALDIRLWQKRIETRFYDDPWFPGFYPWRPYRGYYRPYWW